jgi:hypothetical protein
MSDMLMGFASQSFIPGLKQLFFRMLCFSAVDFNASIFSKGRDLALKFSSEALILKPSSVSTKPVKLN